ncbi:MAG: 5-bromo-4-chloroindolyl phosphate hydrolysis family protein [Methylomicrobium sp.]|nr:5-bromo-4-chloroindolyl phosphate hydrolysis family protein [Methylomicrobium sp.]
MTQSQNFRKPKRFTSDSLQKYSPRGLLLYFLPIALLPAIVIALAKGNLTAILINATAYTLYLFSAWCLRKGLQAETRHRQRPMASPTKYPLKLLAAIITALTTGMLAWLGARQTLPVAAAYAGGAFLGMFLSYGFDPKAKSTQGAQGYSGEELGKALAESHAMIRRIEQAGSKIRNHEFNNRIERICEIADNIIAQIEADPRDFRRARKFLNVYLDGAMQVTEGYAKTHSQLQLGQLEPAQLEQSFRNVLETIETSFLEQQQKLLEDDIFDLDVKIEVLTAQLKREGIL